MAFRCDICGRGTKAGFTVSHAHNQTKRKVRPNLQRVRVLVKGRTTQLLVCTHCQRSGKIQKANR